MRTGGYSLGELAVKFGLALRGDPELRVSRVATLHNADKGAVSFLANVRYRREFESTKATAVIVAEKHAGRCPVAALIDPNPYAAYARVAALLHPPVPVAAGSHPSAVVSANATIAASASVGPLVTIEEGAEIGERVRIGAGSVIQSGVRIGADSTLGPRVTLCANVRIGERCTLHPGVVIGADGFGFAMESRAWLKVPQVGGVWVGDDVEIGANTTVDRGAIDATRIEDGVKLDNQIQVGHNVTIGAHTIIASCTGISGSTVIGKRCMIGGLAGIAGHLTIADDVIITGMSMVTVSIKAPGSSYSSGFPAEETKLWWRRVAQFKRMSGPSKE